MEGSSLKESVAQELQEKIASYQIQQFRKDLLHWYDTEGRVLPWRQKPTPYKVWVSEIMLQQTRVDTVIPYFQRFMSQFPTMEALAEAPEEQVLKAWEGLGYYSRARHLHHAVKEVVAEYGSQVPDDPVKLGELPGIGPYTRGAILSMAYQQPTPAVDGNVLRVFTRLFNYAEDIEKTKTKKEIEWVVAHCIDPVRPGAFNQAIMDLGAMVCTPKNPACRNCPVQQHCLGREAGQAERLPVKIKKIRVRHETYFVPVIRTATHVLLHQRPASGLLAKMWEFPMFLDPDGEDEDSLQLSQWVDKQFAIQLLYLHEVMKLRHQFSHLEWNVHVYQCRWDEEMDVEKQWSDEIKGSYHFIPIDQLAQLPLPVVHQKITEWMKSEFE